MPASRHYGMMTPAQCAESSTSGISMIPTDGTSGCHPSHARLGVFQHQRWAASQGLPLGPSLGVYGALPGTPSTVNFHGKRLWQEAMHGAAPAPSGWHRPDSEIQHPQQQHQYRDSDSEYEMGGFHNFHWQPGTGMQSTGLDAGPPFETSQPQSFQSGQVEGAVKDFQSFGSFGSLALPEESHLPSPMPTGEIQRRKRMRVSKQAPPEGEGIAGHNQFVWAQRMGHQNAPRSGLFKQGGSETLWECAREPCRGLWLDCRAE
mmetsp:Transcript_8450/g.16504  ORF Transcript_8450/g.16504 Transcript_8450/m.16504 type:complete len:261 (-) Transcript_8450:629-1411(-)